jgi:hypothetical protein
MKFIRGYAHIIVPIGKLWKRDIKYQWNDEFQQIFDILKEKMVITPILMFLYWEKESHIHVDAYEIVLRVVLVDPWEGDIDHAIAFARRKLSDS